MESKVLSEKNETLVSSNIQEIANFKSGMTDSVEETNLQVNADVKGHPISTETVDAARPETTGDLEGVNGIEETILQVRDENKENERCFSQKKEKTQGSLKIDFEKEDSNSSLSSINSDSSTGKLIKSLSKTKISSEEGPAIKANTHSIEVPKNSKKKPIRFTVRKVSHEPINLSNSPTEGRFTHKEVGSYEESKSKQTLHDTQKKYDQCVTRISKIDKEVDFLLHLLPPYNVEIDFTTRSKIQRAIEKLRLKQDELSKKKYRLGTMISRLWRESEVSEIWVRGVSNQ